MQYAQYKCYLRPTEFQENSFFSFFSASQCRCGCAEEGVRRELPGLEVGILEQYTGFRY